MSFVKFSLLLISTFSLCSWSSFSYSQGLIDQYNKSVDNQNSARNSCLNMVSEMQYDGLLGFLRVQNNRVFRKEVSDNGTCYWKDSGSIGEEFIESTYTKTYEINSPSGDKSAHKKFLSSQQKLLWKLEGQSLCQYSQGRSFSESGVADDWSNVSKNCNIRR